MTFTDLTLISFWIPPFIVGAVVISLLLDKIE